MLKDFAKINTFLTVVKEKSFSKASKKLGISQPAVTQQIKLLEKYLKHSIVNRKKNGIGLTNEGKEFYRIAQKLDRFLNNLEREVIQVINKNITFNIGASGVIGKYIIPNFVEEIKVSIDNDIMIKVGNSEEIINDLLEKKISIALVEEHNFNSSITFREWMDDELVLFSKYPLPASMPKEQLGNYRWLSRNMSSNTHCTIIDQFEKIGIDYSNFELVSFVSSTTAIKQSMLKSKILKDNEKPMIAFISKHMIKDEVENGQLYMSKIRGMKLHTKLYLAYLKEFKNDAFLKRVTDYLMEKRKI